jgi:hypothetical protein
VQRYQCHTCHFTFSIQNFRLDYRLRRPELNIDILHAFVSKVTHRQCARALGTTRKTVERRIGLYGGQGRELHELLLSGKRLQGSFSLDEAETFETDRRLKPVTVPVLIERDSRFFVHVDVGMLPARKPLGPKLEARLQRVEAVEGVRTSGSRAAVTSCFEALRERTAPERVLQLVTDKKETYPSILKDVLGERPLAHERVSSKDKRDTKNPLFPINHTLAMLRDGVSRLVRRTWGHAKLRARLLQHLWIYVAWRNYVRGVTNKRKRETPAMAVGVVGVRWSAERLLGWRARFALALAEQ